jgi:benzoyl-CoA reductase/2-hydroxyglutaryl-CoA dehydratase subunit BcrC/BadD/HgdB
LSYEGVIEQSAAGLKVLLESGEEVLGYIYPHAPLELILAHGLTPSLVRALLGATGGFEESLQTFACSYIRNLYGQRTNDQILTLAGLLFPGNTCDSLQNLYDVWRVRFPDDTVFRLTYPVTRHEKDESTVKYLTAELQLLSKAIEESLDRPFVLNSFNRGVSLVRQFREDSQYLYSARVVEPAALSYTDLCRLIRAFLTTPIPVLGSELHAVALSVQESMNDQGHGADIESVMHALRTGDFSRIHGFEPAKHPRILVAGGMVEPQAIANLLTNIPRVTDSILALDLLSFGFKTAFTPPLESRGSPFEQMARSILSSPGEPTQEGLIHRMEYAEGIFGALQIDGLIICEQSFCDPDEFEAPSIEKAAKKLGIRTVRIPIDPELSDRARMEVRIQSFLESINRS